MKKHFVFIAICFSWYGMVSLGAENVAQGFEQRTQQENDFNNLMCSAVDSIDIYDLLQRTNGSSNDINRISSGFQATTWPLLLDSYRSSRMSKRVVLLNIVRDIRNRDPKQEDRSNKWYLGNLIDLTFGIADSEKNSKWTNKLHSLYLLQANNFYQS